MVKDRTLKTRQGLKIEDITLAGAISGITGAICGLALGLILKWLE